LLVGIRADKVYSSTEFAKKILGALNFKKIMMEYMTTKPSVTGLHTSQDTTVMQHGVHSRQAAALCSISEPGAAKN